MASASLSKEEQALFDLSARCNDTANDLLERLKRIIRENRKNNTWDSLRTALRTVWSRASIDTLVKRLSEYREQLMLRVLLLLNASCKLQDEKLDILLEKGQEIVEVVTLNLGSLHSFKDQLVGDSIKHEQDRLDAERRHTETIAAILTTRDGSSRTITSHGFSRDATRDLDRPNYIRTTNTYRKPDHPIMRGPNEDLSDIESRLTIDITNRILSMLHFRRISDRRVAVSPAYQKTFEWIYRGSPLHSARWDSLVEWLENGHGCYWVSGKAGSGKSTLMKYLQEDSRTTDALLKWAASSEIIIGSFYFWYAGNVLQKSQQGLLRSILFDVLSKCPQLAIVLFPDLHRSMLIGEAMDREDLSAIELTKAFQTLLSSTSHNLKICLVIDGVDEYEGEHTDICDLLSQAESSTSVKVLLSSRPIPACVHAFGKCPQLSLQKLTENDIEKYVQDKLGRHVLLKRMEIANSGATRQIIHSITSKASGVFLWVTLVVRIISIGLQDYDTLSRLLQKIDQLPPDLENLYDHMLGSMSTQNRVEGSRIIQLVLRSVLTQGDFPMTVLQLSFAEEEDCGRFVPTQISAIPSQTEDWRFESTQGRMRSRCCGLVEVLDCENLVNHRSQKPVGFLHRTVVEFLQMDTVWNQVVSKTAGTGFDVDRTLMSSSLLEMKSKPPNSERPQNSELPASFRSMLRMLSYQRNMVNDEVLMQDYYAEMMATMQYYSGDSIGLSSSSSLPQTKAATRSSLALPKRPPFPFLVSATFNCPPEYLGVLLDVTLGPSREIGLLARRELYAYLLIHFLDEPNLSRRVRLSRAIASCHLFPNQPISLPTCFQPLWNDRWKCAISETGNYYWSPWEFILHYTIELIQCSDTEFSAFIHIGLPESFCDIVLSMVRDGATLNLATLTWTAGQSGDRGRRYEETQLARPYTVLHQLMLRIWDKRASKLHRVSTEVAQANQTLAEKMCTLEDLMRTNKEPLKIVAYPRDHHAVPNVRKARIAPKEIIKESAQSQKRSGISFKKFRKIATPNLSRPEASSTTVKELRDGRTEVMISPDSPWRDYRSRIHDELVKTPGISLSNASHNVTPYAK